MGSYHHGSVRTSTLAAAYDVISRGGPEALSLRELAQCVGVTTPALYRHFDGIDEIVAEVACSAAEHLGRELSQSADELQLAQRYLVWAQAEPHLYRLLFSSRGLGSPTAAERFQEGPPPQRAFVEMCGNGEAALGLWVIVHGIADLAIAGLLGAGSVSTDEALRRALSGHPGRRFSR